MNGLYKYQLAAGAQTSNDIPRPPPTTTTNSNTSSSCYLPAELQMMILETADWKLQPILAQVCRFWRNFIKTSAQIRLNRYFPVEATTYGFDGSAGEEEFPRPRPWVHKSLTYLRQFIVDTASTQKCSFRPCKIEVIEWRSGYHPSCGVWPDMHWGMFKDDPVTIFPGRDSGSLKLAEREIVVSFDCCEFCESLGDKRNQVVPLGPVAKVASYLNFVTKVVTYEMSKCLQKRKRGKWDEGTVVEFWMVREPILVFSPRGCDTDTLRLWFEAKVRECRIDWFA